MFASDIATYQNASSLAVRAIEVLLRLRYLATPTITQAFLKLSIDEDKDIRSRAIPRWPLEIPPPVAGSNSSRGRRQECVDCYSESLAFARRLAACFKR